LVEARSNPGTTSTVGRGQATMRMVSPTSGDVFQASFVWQEPAASYAGGGLVRLSIAAKVDEYKWRGKRDGYLHHGINFASANVTARIDQAGVNVGGVTRSAVYLEAADRKSTPKVSVDDGRITTAAASATVEAAFRAGGREGDERAIYIASSAGMARYTYRWSSGEGGAAPPVTVASRPRTPPRPAAPEPRRTPQGDCNDTDLVRFGDLQGEVNVRPNAGDDDEYIFAELSTPLKHDDRIRTRPRSGAILSFMDMTTFVMKEDSIIVLDICEPRESKIDLVAGQVWVNLKKMIESGSLEVEMSQAVAGIKGTTVIFEENGRRSTVKVIEGRVEVRPRRGGPVVLSDGETVVAEAGRLGAVGRFAVDAELAAWNPKVQRKTADVRAERGGWGWLPWIIGGALCGFAGLLVAGGVLFLTLKLLRGRRGDARGP